MSSADHRVVAAHPWRLPFALERPIVIAAAVVAASAGGVVGGVVALNGLSDVVPAGACPVTGGYYAYAVPDDPAHPPAAGSGAPSWGWMPRKHQVEIGDRMRLNGRLWQVTEIAVMPGVEPVGRPFYIISWPLPRLRRVNGKLVPLRRTGNYSLTMCGRLVFRPVG